MGKLDDTRIVVFKEDYKIKTRRTDEKGQPLLRSTYKKGERHAIHYKMADKLKERGARFEIETVNFQKLKAERKEKLELAKAG